MNAPCAPLFVPLQLRHIELPNRFVRSATYEGHADTDGVPQASLADLYTELAGGGTGTLITGFCFVSREGRAMQIAQCGIHDDRLVPAWKTILDSVRARAPARTVMIMQLAHAGRQTRREISGLPAVGASTRRCSYFRQRVRVLDTGEVDEIARDFGRAARRAREAGFDGVQIHAAHGYLVHQFLSPLTNTRRDRWADRPLLLEEIVRNVRSACGTDFCVLVKLSAADDTRPGLNVDDTIATVGRLEDLDIDAVEISYGTMELALNIIRGACPTDTILRVNPLFRRVPAPLRSAWKRLFLRRYMRRLLPFKEGYNVAAAARIRKRTTLPVIPVGGLRSLDDMLDCLRLHDLAAVSLCRPLIREPDLPARLANGQRASSCTNCNLCTAYCDSRETLRCRLTRSRA